MNFSTFLTGLRPTIWSSTPAKPRRWFFIDRAPTALHSPRLLMVSLRVTTMNVLGVLIQNNLSFRDQVDHLIRLTIYALRILKHHGLCGPPFWEVAGATLMSRLTYASSAWWRFIDAEGRNRLNSVVANATKQGYLPPCQPSFDDISCMKIDKVL